MTDPVMADVDRPTHQTVNNAAARCWLVKAYGDERVYSGNDDHRDDMDSIYRYSNFVPNHLQVRQGDLLLLRGKRGLLGIGRVERIEVAEEMELQRRCPNCNTTSIKYRKTLDRYKCQKCAHPLFTRGEAIESMVKCNRYSASYAGTFIRAANESDLPPPLLRQANERFNNQNAINLIDLGVLAGEVLRIIPGASVLPELAAQAEGDPASVEAVRSSALEGRRLSRLHRKIERDKGIVREKKRQVLRELGRLACEACQFDFEATYGRLGRGFAECHHRLPLGELDRPRETTLDDLAIVCANCHRILHRSQGLTVEGLVSHLAEHRRVNRPR